MNEHLQAERERAKNVLLRLIAEHGGTFNGKMRLNKAFWHAHLAFRRLAGGAETLTDWPIVRAPNGPKVEDDDSLINDLLGEGKIEVHLKPTAAKPERVFRLLVDPPAMGETEVEAIRQGVAACEGKSGHRMSTESHRESREWRNLLDGDTMNVYADLLDEHDYRRMKQSVREAGDLVDSVFADAV